MDIHHHAGRNKVNFSRALLIFFSKIVLGPTQRVHPNLSEVPTVNGFALIRGKKKASPAQAYSGKPRCGAGITCLRFCLRGDSFNFKETESPSKESARFNEYGVGIYIVCILCTLAIWNQQLQLLTSACSRKTWQLIALG